MLATTRIEKGTFLSPFGVLYDGWKVTISDDYPDPPSEAYIQDSIKKILDDYEVKYTVYESRDSKGNFKSYSIESKPTG